MTPSARIAAAIELLAAVDAAPRKPADAVANDYFRTRRFIGSGDRRAVSDRVWSVLRHARRLTWWLQRTRSEPTPRLVVGAAFILEGSPLTAVANLFSGGRFAPDALTGAEQETLRRLEGHTVDHPAMPDAVRYEIPDWLMPHLVQRFGPTLPVELAALLEPAPLDLRVNLLKTDREAARVALAAEGLEAKATRLSPWGLRLDSRRPVTSGAAFQTGLVEIQDEGSQLVALLVGARPGMRVADLCAGAGGKTLAMAMTMDNHGQITACDVSKHRLEAAVRRLRRAGVHNVERHLLVTGDKWTKRHAGAFHRVLVDAPCTGTGTWRRNPDARQRLTERDLAELLPKQAGLLDTAASLVRTGGRLVYATCSLLAEENEAQVSTFLARQPDFGVVPLARAWAIDTSSGSSDTLSLTPRQHDTDGFFAAVLERRS